MKINDSFSSPNFDNKEIPVEFVVLHYTALPLKQTLEHLLNPKSKVSAHLVIARTGEIFELVSCLSGKCSKAWHAGESRWLDDQQKEWKAFNDFSIGIELENLNGNFFGFTEQQYKSLSAVMTVLKGLYAALSDPERVLGHEQIAGFRGKCDPGVNFDWERFFRESYKGAQLPKRAALFGTEEQSALAQLMHALDPHLNSAVIDSVSPHINALMELLLRRKAKTP